MALTGTFTFKYDSEDSGTSYAGIEFVKKNKSISAKLR